MTLEQLRQVTKEQISRLHPLTKREFRAYANNMLCILINNADLIAEEKTSHEQRIEAALSIAKAGRRWHAELEALFAERAPESFGAEEKA